jgi:hypothetical protein
MLLPFHKVYPMQLLGTKDVPDGKGEHFSKHNKKIPVNKTRTVLKLFLFCDRGATFI